MSDNNAINPNRWFKLDFFAIDGHFSVLFQFDDVSAIRTNGHRFRARRNSREALDWKIHGLKTNNCSNKQPKIWVLYFYQNEATQPPLEKRERERTQVRRHLKTWQKMEENVSTVCIYNTRQRKNSKKNKNKTKGCGYSLTRTWFFLIGHIYIYKNYKSGRPHFLVQGFFFYFFFFRFSICDSHPKETYWHWIICQSILIWLKFSYRQRDRCRWHKTTDAHIWPTFFSFSSNFKSVMT